MPKKQHQNHFKTFTTKFYSECTVRDGPFNDAVALKLAMALRDNHHILESIHVNVHDLTCESEGVKELGTSLSQLSNLNTVKLRADIGTSKTHAGVVDRLLECIGTNELVNKLQLRDVVLSKGFVKFLRSKRPRPLTLQLFSCSTDPHMLEIICSAFRESNIQSLDILAYCPGSRGDLLARGLLEASRNHDSLSELTIQDLVPSYTTLIRHVVQESSRLRHLSLTCGELEDVDIPKELFDDLGLSRIQKLEFLYTRFSTRAVDACTLYLRTNVHLTELAIQLCTFQSNDALGVLLSALHGSHNSKTRLRKLELTAMRENVVSRVPGLVRDLLLQNQTIESLTLEAKLENASLLPLAEGIRGNESLKELDLSGNDHLSSVGHLMPALMQRPKPLGLILHAISLPEEGLNEISGALEGQVRLKQLAFCLQATNEGTTRFFRSLSINEHLVDLSLWALNLEQVDVLADTIGSFVALEKLKFTWPVRSDRSEEAKAARCSRFLVAMSQNTTLLSVCLQKSPFKVGDIELYTLRNLFHRYGRHGVAVKAGWPTGISSHLLCRFLPKECPHAGQLWAMTYLKEISAGIGHPKQWIGGKRALDEDLADDLSSANTANESNN